MSHETEDAQTAFALLKLYLDGEADAYIQLMKLVDRPHHVLHALIRACVGSLKVSASTEEVLEALDDAIRSLARSGND